jgi:hypothetical protein
MFIGMALVSRILTGEEPCLRKVQLSRRYKLPKDAKLIQYKMKHELLVSKVISELTGDVFVNQRVEKNLGDINIVGFIDILNVNSTWKTIFEVKSGKEKESHHVQLWFYMNCFNEAKGILQYPETRYTYLKEDIPFDLWKTVLRGVNPLMSKLLPPVKGDHC